MVVLRQFNKEPERSRNNKVIKNKIKLFDLNSHKAKNERSS